MKNLASYFRVVVLLVIGYLLIEYTVPVQEGSVFTTYPIAWLVLAVAGVFAIGIELSVSALQNILFQSLSDEAKERYVLNQKERQTKRWAWLTRIYDNLLDKKPIEKEDEIILDHNYDGIKELDNNLPPWWLYGFYGTIIFGAVYMVRFHIIKDYDQVEEYQTELAEAQAAIEEYKKTAKNLVDVNTVEMLTDKADLTAGEKIFMTNCVACHKADGGGGIGPNLTDEYWILGGGIKNVFKTISEGGRSGKGMVAWDQTLKPLERAQVASYVLSLQGTTPADPKAPEGEIWKSETEATNAGENNAAEAQQATENTSETMPEAENAAEADSTQTQSE